MWSKRCMGVGALVLAVVVVAAVLVLRPKSEEHQADKPGRTVLLPDAPGETLLFGEPNRV